MSAVETLREAARLMRERAEAATPGPWWTHPADDGESVWRGDRADVLAYDGDPGRQELEDCPPVGYVCTIDYEGRRPADAAHIAAWHPAVAHAVADLLGVLASQEDYRLREFGHRIVPNEAHTVARAYLGASSS